MNPNTAMPKDILPPLANSGFPLQTAVVGNLSSIGGLIVEEEVAWRDGDGSHKFLDVVASIGYVRMCIECKALRGEKLIFLVPGPTGQIVTGDVYAVHLTRCKDSTRRPLVMYGLSQTQPLTAESLYCVVAGKKAGEGRLIEREAQPLVHATEEYAKDRCIEFNPDDSQAQSVVCVPILLTTAQLFVAEYDPLTISLQDGIYRAREEHLKPVSCVRFAKQFTAQGPRRTRLRTVLVAQADFLEQLANTLKSAHVSQKEDEWLSLYDSLSGEVRHRP